MFRESAERTSGCCLLSKREGKELGNVLTIGPEFSELYWLLVISVACPFPPTVALFPEFKSLSFFLISHCSTQQF